MPDACVAKPCWGSPQRRFRALASGQIRAPGSTRVFQRAASTRPAGNHLGRSRRQRPHFCGGAVVGARRGPFERPHRASADPIRVAGRWILPLVLVSGAVSFTYEVLWSRLLGNLLGGSIYAFATMLGSFLTGIAAGSAVASRFASSPENAARGFAWAQFGTAALSLTAFLAADRLPALSQVIAAGGGTHQVADAAVAAATLLPAALCIGATLPFGVRVLARSGSDAGPASARVFAWNTLGAIAGAVGTGFFLLPALGYAAVLTLGVVTNLALALAAIRPRPSNWRSAAWVAATGSCCLVLLPPDPPWNLLRASALPSAPATGRTVYYGVGRSATVLVLEQDGIWLLRTNGLPEAEVQLRGAPAAGGSVSQWLGAASSLARPEARSMLVVGLGGGVALEAVPSLIESIDVVEIEPEVVLANRAMATGRREDPLSDPRVRLITNDARGALLLSEKRYDVIVSQPSHPWTAGAAHLYTREFFALAREHLAPAGILVQWMSLRLADESLLRTLVATLVDVFPHVRVYQPRTNALIFLASSQPLSVEARHPHDCSGAGRVRRARSIRAGRRSGHAGSGRGRGPRVLGCDAAQHRQSQPLADAVFLARAPQAAGLPDIRRLRLSRPAASTGSDARSCRPGTAAPGARTTRACAPSGGGRGGPRKARRITRPDRNRSRPPRRGATTARAGP